MPFYRRLLGEFVDDGFVSLISIDDTPGVRFCRELNVFLNACLHHAKQRDTFVGIFDQDELPVITRPGRDGRSLPMLLFARLHALANKKKRGPPAACDGIPASSPPSAACVAAVVGLFCQIRLPGFTAMQFESPGDDRSVFPNFLGTRFVRRPIDAAEDGRQGRYQKTVAIASTVFNARVHQHTNCVADGTHLPDFAAFADWKRTGRGGNWGAHPDATARFHGKRRQAIYVEDIPVAMFHFLHLFVRRYPRNILASDPIRRDGKGPVSAPSEYTVHWWPRVRRRVLAQAAAAGHAMTKDDDAALAALLQRLRAAADRPHGTGGLMQLLEPNDERG